MKIMMPSTIQSKMGASVTSSSILATSSSLLQTLEPLILCSGVAHFNIIHVGVVLMSIILHVVSSI
jgi:hypothetical protein